MYLIFSGSNRQFASAARSVRNGHPRIQTTYLGKVIDESRNIFHSTERGFFTFDLKTGSFGEVPEDFDFQLAAQSLTPKESRCLDFGDAFFIDNFLYQSGLVHVIDTIPVSNKDTLHALVSFYMLSSLASRDCCIWYKGSIARYLYPGANLCSQRISDVLACIGAPENRVIFLEAYSRFVIQSYCPDSNILIDSSGLPNSIHMPETRINVHNGKVSNETRLIFVVQRATGLPLFYESVPGNIVDVATLEHIYATLDAMAISVESCIIDAGLNSASNLDTFYDEHHKCKVGFITRASSSDKRMKAMIRENLKTIESRENLIRYKDRFLYIVRKPVSVGKNLDHPAWMYLGLDCTRQAEEQKNLIKRAKKKDLTDDEIFEAMQNEGFFALISDREYDIEDILPAYYQRQQIEQTFDIVKNYTKLLPLREHSSRTYSGHLLISFIACCAMKMIQLGLKTEDLFLGSRLSALRNQKCIVYQTKVVPDCIQAEAREVYSTFGIENPVSLPLTPGRKLIYKRPDPVLFSGNDKPKDAGITTSKRGRGRPPGSKNKKTLEKDAVLKASQPAGDVPAVQKRGRGRPPGSKNKKTLEKEAALKASQPAGDVPAVQKRGRGRPPGSKNKKTLEKEAALKASQPAGDAPAAQKRGRGRPPGSKNKKTLEKEAALKASQPAGDAPAAQKRGRGRPPGSKTLKNAGK